jgi:hypothetical protein
LLSFVQISWNIDLHVALRSRGLQGCRSHRSRRRDHQIPGDVLRWRQKQTYAVARIELFTRVWAEFDSLLGSEDTTRPSFSMAACRALHRPPRRLAASAARLHVALQLRARNVRARAVLLRLDRAFANAVVELGATHAQDLSGLGDIKTKAGQGERLGGSAIIVGRHLSNLGVEIRRASSHRWHMLHQNCPRFSSGF